jgi:P4 family phage/plasmid primase-like protien
MREQCLLFLYGDGNNGKTVFIQLLRYLLGGYATTAAIELFVTTGIGKHLTGFAALHRKRCVIANETQKGHTLRMDVIKSITGQDPIRANFMRQDTFEFLPVCKLMMFGNHKPSLPNAGKAERKRIRMIPCKLQLAAHEIDSGLLAKLMAEGPGIWRALIDGCRDWQEHGLITPECVIEHTENYFYTQDSFNKWVEACCDVGPNMKDASTVLWKSWQIWSRENNVDRLRPPAGWFRHLVLLPGREPQISLFRLTSHFGANGLWLSRLDCAMVCAQPRGGSCLVDRFHESCHKRGIHLSFQTPTEGPQFGSAYSAGTTEARRGLVCTASRRNTSHPKSSISARMTIEAIAAMGSFLTYKLASGEDVSVTRY